MPIKKPGLYSDYDVTRLATGGVLHPLSQEAYKLTRNAIKQSGTARMGIGTETHAAALGNALMAIEGAKGHSPINAALHHERAAAAHYESAMKHRSWSSSYPDGEPQLGGYHNAAQAKHLEAAKHYRSLLESA